MKLQIQNDPKAHIEGYKVVAVENETIDIPDVSANECTEILAGDALDEFQIHNIPKLLGFLRSKLRIGGVLTIGGTDARLLAMSILNGSVPEEEYCNIVYSHKSLTKCTAVVNMIRELGLSVEQYEINGIHFQVTARRV